MCVLGELLPGFSSAPHAPGLAGSAARGSFGAGTSRADILHLGAQHRFVMTLAPSHGEWAIYFLPTWLSTCLPGATCSPSADGGIPSRDESRQLGASKLLRALSTLLHGGEGMHSLCLEGGWLKGMQLRSASEPRTGCLGRDPNSRLDRDHLAMPHPGWMVKGLFCPKATSCMCPKGW